MRRWWVSLALLVSLGVNLGLLGAIAAGRWEERAEPAAEPPPPAAAEPSRELPGSISIEVPETESVPEPEPERERVPAIEAVPESEPLPESETVSESEPVPGPGSETTAHRPRDRRGRPGFEHRPGEPPLGRLADHLGLEGERRERFVALQRTFLATHLEARRERFRLGAELRRELTAEEPDRERVEELLARLGDVHAESERATAEVILASRELLDDDQRETYFRFLERLRDGRGPAGRMHAGGRGPR